MLEEVVLVNEKDEALGTMEKMAAHEQALLHRAFSVFVFNTNGDLLMQQRAFSKYHSGGLWTNTCCSHPRPGEQVADAAIRRLQEEMGFKTNLTKAFDFTYKAAFDNGLTEHEFDHVFTGIYEGPIHFNPNEVAAYAFMTEIELEEQIKKTPERFTAWFHIAYPTLKAWMADPQNKIHAA
jgi:isopentenyl-diphosphate delta-isomerase